MELHSPQFPGGVLRNDPGGRVNTPQKTRWLQLILWFSTVRIKMPTHVNTRPLWLPETLQAAVTRLDWRGFVDKGTLFWWQQQLRSNDFSESSGSWFKDDQKYPAKNYKNRRGNKIQNNETGSRNQEAILLRGDEDAKNISHLLTLSLAASAQCRRRG